MGPAVLTLRLRQIVSHITKLFWPLQPSESPAFPFSKRCQAIGVPVDNLASQIGYQLGGGSRGRLVAPSRSDIEFKVRLFSSALTLAWA